MSRLCQCGCGRRVPLASRTDKRRGLVKGRPVKFLEDHQHRLYRPNATNFHEPGWYLKQQG